MNNTLVKQVWINCSVEEAFDCFTKPESMLAWHGKEVELNPVPGGIYKVVFEDGTVILGAYKEIDQNQRLVYTASYGEVWSEIEVKFTSENGGVRIDLVQEFAADQDTSSFDQGWDYFLEKLHHLLSLAK